MEYNPDWQNESATPHILKPFATGSGQRLDTSSASASIRAGFASHLQSLRNDARGIAQMMRVGLYRPVHVKTLRSQKLRMLLTEAV